MAHAKQVQEHVNASPWLRMPNVKVEVVAGVCSNAGDAMREVRLICLACSFLALYISAFQKYPDLLRVTPLADLRKELNHFRLHSHLRRLHMQYVPLRLCLLWAHSLCFC